MNIKLHKQKSLHPASRIPHPSLRAFTLIELLVVITIIGILAALITVAAIGALKQATRTRIKSEIGQIAGAIDDYKNKTTAYPPNCQSDDNDLGKSNPLDEATTFSDLKRHMKQAFPRHQESDNLLRLLMGMIRDANSSDKASYSKAPLNGGMTAGEALVFWLSGFSADPKYPISGDGGPSYIIQAYGNSTNRTLDPVENRGKGAGAYPFEVTRLVPRASDGYFDESDARYVEYTDPKGALRRINFWQYNPAKSDQPYLYFDTSRHPVGVVNSSNKFSATYDPPAATAFGPNRVAVNVYAFKKAGDSPATGQPAIQYINPDKFQVIHCGLANAWDTDNFPRMAVTIGATNTASNYLLFPTGPFTGDIAETIVNFTQETKIEDSQK